MHLMYYLDSEGKRVYTLKVREFIAITHASTNIIFGDLLLCRKQLRLAHSRIRHTQVINVVIDYLH